MVFICVVKKKHVTRSRISHICVPEDGVRITVYVHALHFSEPQDTGALHWKCEGKRGDQKKS